MNDKVLNNIWSYFTDQNLTDSDYDSWKKNVSESVEVQKNIHQHLTENKLTDSGFDQWAANAGLSQPQEEEELTPEMMETGQRNAAPAYVMTEEKYAAEKKKDGESPSQDGEFSYTELSSKEESDFQDFINNDPDVVKWRDEFKEEWGEEPQIDGADYDYRGAWKAGIKPKPTYEPETKKTLHHWDSIGVGGKDLKSESHSTRWKSDYMKATGINPDEAGITKEQALSELGEDVVEGPVFEELPEDFDLAAELSRQTETVGRDTREYGYIDPRKQMGAYPTKEFLDRSNEQLLADQEFTAKKIEAEETTLAELRKKEEKQAEEERAIAEKETYELNLDEGFLKDLQVASVDMMGKKEGDVVPMMNDIYSKYGFSFRKTGIDNEMQVIADNGKKTFIELKPILKSDQIDSSRRLQKFLKDNAIPVTKEIAEVEKNEVKNAARALNLRKVGRLNDDGTESTVLMASGEVDGKYVAYPTLFPKDPENHTSAASSWMELDGMDAIKEANNRNELFYFDTEEEAQKFAEGSWKDFSNADAEADLFFEKKGLNYMSYKNNYDRFEYALDRSEFLKEAPRFEDELTEDEAKKYGDLYVNGTLRSDAGKIQEDLEKEADSLRDFVNDKDYLVTRYEFDSHMQEKYDKKAQIAVTTNNISKAQIEKVNDMSVELFGVSLNELSKYQPKTNEEVDKINSIVEAYNEAMTTRQMAANQYDVASTYLNEKFEKSIRGKWLENGAAFNDAVKKAWHNGRAADAIMMESLGFTDMTQSGMSWNDVSSEEVAQKIIDALSETETGKNSIVAQRFHSSKNFKDIWDTFKDDPAELALTMAAESMAQLGPMWLKIVPTTTLMGMGIGGGIGATGFSLGPIGFATTGGGILTGGATGYKTGSSAVSFSLEYTNAVLDAVRNSDKGYDIMNVDDLAAALQDEDIWREGREIGLKRGIPIAVVDYLTSGLAGRFLKVGSVASRTAKVAAGIGERFVFDPAAEALGEFTAQVVAGQDINLKEGVAEALGGVGSKTPMAGINMYMDARNKTNVGIANDLSDISFMANESSSDGAITKWANNMERLGHITAEQNQRIQENVAIRIEARDLLNVGSGKVPMPFTASNKVQARTMELLASRDELTSTQNRRAVFGSKVAEINAELQELVTNKKLRPREKQTVLAGTGVTEASRQATGTDIREGIKTYNINDKAYTREEFLSRIADMSEKQLKKANVAVKNDDSVLDILRKKGKEIAQKVEETSVLRPKGDDEGVDLTAPTYEAPTQVTSPTSEAFATVNRNDGKGTVSLTEDEYNAETEKFALVEENAIKTPSEFLDEMDPEGDMIRSENPIDDVQEILDTYKKMLEEETYGEGRREELLNRIKEVEDVIRVVNLKKETVPTETTEDAIQEQSPEGVDVQEPAAEGGEVGEGDVRETTEEVDTQDQSPEAEAQVKQEEVALEHAPNTKYPHVVHKGDVGEFSTEGDGVSFFTRDKTSAENYTSSREEQGGEKGRRTVSVVLDTKNPLTIDATKPSPIRIVTPDGKDLGKFGDESTIENAKKEGYDAIIINKKFGDELDGWEVVALDKSIIKEIPTESKTTEAPIVVSEGKVKQDAIQEPSTEAEAQVKQEADDLADALGLDDDVKFQLETEMSNKERKETLEKEADNLMNEVQPENVTTVSEPTMEPIPIEVTENKELSDKVPKMSVMDLVGKVVNYVMADRLKVSDKYSGGPFFPLMIEYFGKVAWASIDLKAAKEIVRGAIKGDYSVVYNMKETAVDSNRAVLDEIISKIDESKDSNKIFSEFTKYLKSVTFADKTAEVHRIANESKSFSEFADAMLGLDVDTRSAIVKKALPSEYISPKTEIGILLKKNGITQESIRESLSEQFTFNVPMGGVTMVLEVTDSNGNKITSLENINDAIITPKQQDAEGIKRHPNYPYMIRGRVVAMLKDTVPFWSLDKEVGGVIDKKLTGVIKKKLPEAQAKKRGEKTRQTTSSEARSDAMRQRMGAASQARTVSLPTPTVYQRFIGRLSKAFPSVEVVTSQAEFDALIRGANAKQLVTSTQKVYGAVYKGKLYLNPALENFNTPIHEFGHVWLNVARELGKDTYKKGMELMTEDSPYYQQVINSKEYGKIIAEMRKDGASKADIETYIKEEALATAIGDKGESFKSAALNKNFKNWLNELFEFIGKLTGISELTPDQLQNITLDEFVQGVVVDLMSENEVFAGAEVKSFGEQLQLMTVPENSMTKIIEFGRAENFSDASIKEILKKRGFSVAEINKAMVVNIDMQTQLPLEFNRVKGGVTEASEMFNDVRDKLRTFAKGKRKKLPAKKLTVDEKRAKANELRQLNPSLFEISDDEILRKYPEPAQYEVISAPTISEVRAKAIELLREHPVFKKQSDAVQGAIFVGFDKTIGTKANKKVQDVINAIKNKAKAMRQGVRDIKDAQLQLKSALKDMPMSNDIRRIIKAVGDVNQDNILAQLERITELVDNIRSKDAASAAQKNALQVKILELKKNAKDLATLKGQIRRFIGQSLPVSDTYTQGQMKKVNAIIDKINFDNQVEQVQKVLDIVEGQRSKMRNAVVKRMLDNAKKYAAKQRKGKLVAKAGSVEAQGQAFFAEAAKILQYAYNNDTESMLKLAQELSDLDGIDEIVQKEINGESLTQQEQALLDRVYAFDTFGDIMNMDLDDVMNLENAIADVKKESSIRLKNARLERSARYAKLSKESKNQIRKGFRELFSISGNLKTVNQLNQTSKAIYEEFKRNGTVAAVKRLVDDIGYSQYNPINFIKNMLMHMGTMSTILDKGGSFFTDNIVNPLKDANENFLRGYQNQTQRLDDLANAIKGIDGGYKQIRDLLKGKGMFVAGVDQSVDADIASIRAMVDENPTDPNTLANAKKLIAEVIVDRMKYLGMNKSDIKAQIKAINNTIDAKALIKEQVEFIDAISKLKQVDGVTLNKSQLLRVYALSKNDAQREKLKGQGFTGEVMAEIEQFLGPELIAFADNVVDYLSSEYYESVNDVHVRVNDINLDHIENYFPTMSIRSAKPTEYGADNFAKGFSQMSPSAISQRVDMKSGINLTQTFDGALQNHFQHMERYKAYAETVNTIHKILAFDHVNALLDRTGLKKMYYMTVDNDVNPSSESNVFFQWVANRFYGMTLGFKLIQIPKQATSFINAYEQYSFFKDGKKKKLGVLGPDLIGFAYDYVKVLAFFRSNLKTARLNSATINQRVLDAYQGDVFGLESGPQATKEQRNEFIRWWNVASASPTTFGDILGVMGYMAVYNRNIANGMSPKEAIRIFNDYNETQQSRRGTEASPIQIMARKQPLLRMMTMFSSTMLLQINKVYQSSVNVMRDISNKKVPSKRDIRSIYLNAGLANVLFVLAGNMMKLMDGDDEDKEEVYTEMKRAMLFMNQMKKLPIFGSAVASIEAFVDEKRALPSIQAPLDRLTYDIAKSIKDEDYTEVIKRVFDFAGSTNLDMFQGIIQGTTEGFEDEVIYDILGLPKSARPKGEKEKKEKKEKSRYKERPVKRYMERKYKERR